MSNSMNMLVYNQKYTILLPGSLSNGRALDYRPDRRGFESVTLEKIFLFAFETNGRNFESTVEFFLNFNVKLKYILEYLCWYLMNQTLVIL